MNFKKAFAGLFSFAVLASACSSAALQAAAAETERTYQESQLTAFLYTDDCQTAIDCRIYDDMPNVPYVRLSDFYKDLTEDEITIRNNQDGSYDITVPLGGTATIDTGTDLLTTECFSDLTAVRSEEDGTGTLSKWFVDSGEESIEDDLLPVTMDFAKYSIDIVGDENDLWFP